MPHGNEIKTRPIYVILIVNVKGVFFNPHRPEGIKFKAGDQSNLRFDLKPLQPDNDGSGLYSGLECKVYATIDAPNEHAMFIEAYNKGQMLQVATGINLPLVSKSGEIRISEYGYFPKDFHPRRHHCPVDFVKFIEKVEEELTTHAERFLKLIRWRQCIDSEGTIIRSTSLYCTVETSGDYFCLPLSGGKSELTIPGLHGIQWDNQDESDISDLWSNPSFAEPLGHALLREASSISVESPRSSILIMMAALETAVKMHISKLAPDTAWLMEESASPPIFKILRDYLPQLHTSRGKDMRFWKQLSPLIKRVQNLVEVRNKVAHTGKIPENADAIDNNLHLVSDILYILDVLDDIEWAKTHVSHDVRKLLGWPPPKNGRIFVCITEDC